MDLPTLFRWIGTLLQGGGALWLAANVSTSRLAFPGMLVGSVIWAALAVVDRDWALATQSFVFAAINVLGMARWRR
jgi:hypothetical protein